MIRPSPKKNMIVESKAMRERCEKKISGSVPKISYKAVDLIAKAHPRTRADLCTWIHLNPPHNKKKKVIKKKKVKK